VADNVIEYAVSLVSKRPGNSRLANIDYVKAIWIGELVQASQNLIWLKRMLLCGKFSPDIWSWGG
jgi:hypothetical protein